MSLFYRWLAWYLPRELVSFAVCRVVAETTSGPYSHQPRSELTADQALDRWAKMM